MLKYVTEFDTSLMIGDGIDISCGKDFQQCRVFVMRFAPSLFAFQDAEFLQFMQVFRGGLALGDADIHQELYLAIRLGEYQFHEFFGVNLGRQASAAAGQCLVKQVAYGKNTAGGPCGRFFHPGKDEHQPRLPLAALGDAAEQLIVFRLVLNEVSAEVKDRYGQKASVDEKQDVQNTAGSSIAVSERMNGFKLVMGHGHAHQRVYAIIGQKEFFQIIEFFPHHSIANRRGIDNGLGGRVADIDSFVAAKLNLFVTKHAAQFLKQAEPKRLGLHRFKAPPQGGDSIRFRYLSGFFRHLPTGIVNNFFRKMRVLPFCPSPLAGLGDEK